MSVPAPSSPATPPAAAHPVAASAALSILPAEYHTGVMPLALATNPPAAAAAVAPGLAKEIATAASPPAETATVHQHLRQQQQQLILQQQQMLQRQPHWAGPTTTPLHTGTEAAPPLPSAQQVYLHRTAAAPLVLSPFNGSAASPTRQQQQLYSQHQQPLSYLLVPSGAAALAAATPAASSLVGLGSKHQLSSGHPHIGGQQQNMLQQQIQQQVQQLQLEPRQRENQDPAGVEAVALQESDSRAAAVKAAAGAPPATAAEGEPSLLAGFVGGDNKQIAGYKTDVSATVTGSLPLEDEHDGGRYASAASWEPRTAAAAATGIAAAPATATEAAAAGSTKEIRWVASTMGEALELAGAELEQTQTQEGPKESGDGAGESSAYSWGEEDNDKKPGTARNPEESKELLEFEAETEEVHLAGGHQTETGNETQDTADEGVALGLRAGDSSDGKRNEEDAAGSEDEDKDSGEGEDDEILQLLPSSSSSTSIDSTTNGHSHQVHWLDGDIPRLEADLQRGNTAETRRPLHDEHEWEYEQQHQQQQKLNLAKANSSSSLKIALNPEALTASGADTPLASPVSDVESPAAVGPIAATLPGSSLSHSPVVDASTQVTGQDVGTRVLLHPSGDQTLLLLQQPLQHHLPQPNQQQVLQQLQQPLQHPLQQSLQPLPQPPPQPLQPPLQQQLGEARSLLTPQEVIKQQQLQLQQQHAMVQQLQQQVAMQQDLLLRAQEQQLQQTQHQRMQQQQQQLLHMQLAHVSEKQQVQGALLQHHLHQLQQQQLHQQKLRQLQQQQPSQSRTQVL